MAGDEATLKYAIFPDRPSLGGFEFADRVANEAMARIRQYSEFIAKTRNITLIGGYGKCDAYIGIGVQVTADTPYNLPENCLE